MAAERAPRDRRPPGPHPPPLPDLRAARLRQQLLPGRTLRRGARRLRRLPARLGREGRALGLLGRAGRGGAGELRRPRQRRPRRDRRDDLASRPVSARSSPASPPTAAARRSSSATSSSPPSDRSPMPRSCSAAASSTSRRLRTRRSRSSASTRRSTRRPRSSASRRSATATAAGSTSREYPARARAGGARARGRLPGRRRACRSTCAPWTATSSPPGALKYLLGSAGLAFLYCRQRPRRADLADSDGLVRRSRHLPDGHPRLLPAPDGAPLRGRHASGPVDLRWHRRHGADEGDRHRGDRGPCPRADDLLIEGVEEELGGRVVTPRDPARRGPLVAVASRTSGRSSGRSSRRGS